MRALTLGLLLACEAAAWAQPFPRTIEAGDKRTITLAAPPRRIVSVVLAVDHILSALVDKNRIQAVTNLAADPFSSHVTEWARSIPRKIDVNVEQIIDSEPDLVIVARYTRADTVKLLLNAGLPVLRLESYASIRDVENNILKVGEAVGAEEKARALVARMDKRLASIERTVARFSSRPRVVHYTKGGFIAGSDTTYDEIIVRAGGINLGAEKGRTGFRKMSTENLIMLDPEVILVGNYGPAKGDAAAQLYADPMLRTIRAVKARRIYSIPGRNLGAVDQFIVDGIEDIVRVLHPELSGVEL